MALRIMVPVDNSESSRQCEAVALKVAKILQAEVTLFHAVNTGGVKHKNIPDFQVDIIRKRAREAGHQFLTRRTEEMSAHAVKTRSVLIEAEPGQAASEEANRGYDFVMVGARVHSDIHVLLFGSVSSDLIHNCQVPLVVVKHGGHTLDDLVDRPVRMLMALDQSLASEHCVNFFSGYEAAENIELTLMNVKRDKNSDVSFMADHEATLKETGYQTKTIITEGKPAAELCRTSSEGNYDFIIVGLPKKGDDLHGLGNTVCHRLFHDCGAHQILVPWDFARAAKN
jgi:nucleotide-binding universal stress UspA family protein